MLQEQPQLQPAQDAVSMLRDNVINGSNIVTICAIASIVMLLGVITRRLPGSALFFRTGPTQRAVEDAVAAMNTSTPTSTQTETTPDEQDTDGEHEERVPQAPTWQGIINDFSIYDDES